jgi:hypothetical protein
LANKIYRIDDELSSAIQIFSNIADYSKDHGGSRTRVPGFAGPCLDQLGHMVSGEACPV